MTYFSQQEVVLQAASNGTSLLREPRPQPLHVVPQKHWFLLGTSRHFPSHTSWVRTLSTSAASAFPSYALWNPKTSGRGHQLTLKPVLTTVTKELREAKSMVDFSAYFTGLYGTRPSAPLNSNHNCLPGPL